MTCKIESYTKHNGYVFGNSRSVLTVAPGEDVKVEDTWIFFIVLSVSGGQGE